MVVNTIEETPTSSIIDSYTLKQLSRRDQTTIPLEEISEELSIDEKTAIELLKLLRDTFDE